MSDSLSMIKISLIFWQITLRRNAKGKGRGSKRDRRKGTENESLLHLTPPLHSHEKDQKMHENTVSE
jgi:hypothetical protein